MEETGSQPTYCLQLELQCLFHCLEYFVHVAELNIFLLIHVHVATF